MARCHSGRVVVIAEARFGRMKAGRCVTNDYHNSLGCSSDISTNIADVCNGKSNCTFLVAVLDSLVEPCAKDFKSYLEVTWTCKKGFYLTIMFKVSYYIALLFVGLLLKL